MSLTPQSSLNGPDRAIWLNAHGEEIVRIIEFETSHCIHLFEMPKDRKAAFYNPQLKIIHCKSRNYAHPVERSRVERRKFLTADIKDFYFGTPMDRKEYMRINTKHIPADTEC